ncbi:hypothetical protein LCGC14_1942190 [marine sediment metagenome]|uniref:Uncharacterized protein n=1 Tax=marine sediment metagenome TaxID=412755 RepID=A0A0F9HYB2_9ZZZZ
MTNKEIDIQRALGTLPLWKRIELGEIEFEEMYWAHSGLMLIGCEGIREHYVKGDFAHSNRRGAIKLLIAQAKKLNL